MGKTLVALAVLLVLSIVANDSNAQTFTKIDDPLGSTTPCGISGNNVVGAYTDSSRNTHGFVYNGSTYTTLDDPLATNGTEATGISGSNIVGPYFGPPGADDG